MLMLALLQLLRNDELQALFFFFLKKLSDENSELFNVCQLILFEFPSSHSSTYFTSFSNLLYFSPILGV